MAKPQPDREPSEPAAAPVPQVAPAPVPVTLTAHSFWGLSDPVAAQLQRVQFFKNLSMLGAALLIAHFGAGPLSLDALVARRTRARNSAPPA